MIKNSFRIYKNDLKKVFTNYAAIIIIFTLALLPSFYAWFNIKACWDPYSAEATGQIKVAVVNKDTGAELNGKEINLGEQVVDELKNNNTLGWVFMSEEESIEALEKGKIYASIALDEEFSKDITSFITKDIKKGKIIYSVNEKINAIAPKITSKGATAVQDKVDAAVVETVSKVVLSAAQEAGYKIKDDIIPKLQEAENILVDISGRFDEINSTVNNADTSVDKIKELLVSVQKDMPLIKDTIANTQNLTQSVESFISKAKEGLNNIAPTIKEDLNMANSISSEISKYVDLIIDAVNNNSAELPNMIASLHSRLNTSEKLLDSAITIFNKLNDMSINKQLQNVIDQLNSLKSGVDNALNIVSSFEDSINNGQGIDLSLLENIKKLADNMNNTTSNILNIFDSDIVSQIDQICDEAFVVAQNVLESLKAAETKFPDADNIINSVLDILNKSSTGLDYLKENLPKAETRILELRDKMADANNNSAFNELIDLLLNDVEARAQFLASPVEIVENDLYPISNYGTAMSPFYSVLCLWVGTTLMVSMLSAEAHGAYSPREIYLGKLYLFVTVGILQGVIVALGDLYLLKIYCVNPLVFFLGLVYSAIVFTTIVYTLVSVFGNIGKVIAIILLVLQVAGSGGTFPIQLTPKFFQIINPYLPFTYAISMEREAIGGIVQDVLYRDIGVLSLYILGSLIIGLLLKKIVNKRVIKFSEKFKESGLGE